MQPVAAERPRARVERAWVERAARAVPAQAGSAAAEVEAGVTR